MHAALTPGLSKKKRNRKKNAGKSFLKITSETLTFHLLPRKKPPPGIFFNLVKLT
jgi:hypothetical protein